MSKGTIALVAPVARVGDTVEVLNYRMRPAVWERGEVIGVAYRQTAPPPLHAFWISYEVVLERRGATNNPIRLYTHSVRAIPAHRSGR